MKNLLLVILLMPFFGKAQDMVRVEYRKTLSREVEKKENESADDALFREAQEKELKRPRVAELTASKDEAVYRIIPKINNNQDEEATFTVRIATGLQEPTYKSAKDKTFVVSQETYGKNILITDSLDMYDWEITRESKEILGIKTRKATAYDKKSKEDIEIWYAPGLAMPFGPEKLGDTPGLVLEYATKSRGKRKSVTHFIAVELNPLELYTLEKPTKGSVLSEEKYHEWLDEVNKKQREMYSGGVDTDN